MKLTCFTFSDTGQQKWELYAQDYMCFLHVAWTQFVECLLKWKKYLEKSCIENKNAHFVPCSVFLIYLTVSEIFKQSELITRIIMLCLHFRT